MAGQVNEWGLTRRELDRQLCDAEWHNCVHCNGYVVDHYTQTVYRGPSGYFCPKCLYSEFKAIEYCAEEPSDIPKMIDEISELSIVSDQKQVNQFIKNEYAKFKRISP